MVKANFLNMEKIWHRGFIKYLQKKGLAFSEFRGNIVDTLGDDVPGLSTEQK